MKWRRIGDQFEVIAGEPNVDFCWYEPYNGYMIVTSYSNNKERFFYTLNGMLKNLGPEFILDKDRFNEDVLAGYIRQITPEAATLLKLLFDFPMHRFGFNASNT